MEQYAIYLRKSRKDDEAELRGEGNTLKRHRDTLVALAEQQGLYVARVFEEMVSGDTVEARPEMQNLLREVESGMWTGVLVMEVERLARGDTKDQGRVAQAFKYSETLIITPQKTFDPTNEFDEEYFEFGLFMSRRELKTITRRLQRGRMDSIKEGKYVASSPPYGYTRVKLEGEKGWTLEPHPEQADIVRLIYQWYTLGVKQVDGSHERIGVTLIARKLNKMKIPPQKGEAWASTSIRDILINPVYIGMVRWNWRPHKKKMAHGDIFIERPRLAVEDCVLVKGRHEGIIDPTVFEMAQENINKNPPRPVGEKYTTKNPWAGLIVCGKCGNKMTRRPYNKNGYPDTLLCQNISCNNVSSHLAVVGQRILEALGDWLIGYKLEWDLSGKSGHKMDNQYIIKQKALANLDKELTALQKRLDGIHNRFEEGSYSKEIFLERSHKVNEQIGEIKRDRAALETGLQLEDMLEKTRTAIVPSVEKLLEVYHELPTAGAKNDMLKEVLEKVVYTKETKGSKTRPAHTFEIVLYPKLPMKS